MLAMLLGIFLASAIWQGNTSTVLLCCYVEQSYCPPAEVSSALNQKITRSVGVRVAWQCHKEVGRRQTVTFNSCLLRALCPQKQKGLNSIQSVRADLRQLYCRKFARNHAYYTENVLCDRNTTLSANESALIGKSMSFYLYAYRREGPGRSLVQSYLRGGSNSASL